MAEISGYFVDYSNIFMGLTSYNHRKVIGYKAFKADGRLVGLLNIEETAIHYVDINNIEQYLA